MNVLSREVEQKIIDCSKLAQDKNLGESRELNWKQNDFIRLFSRIAMKTAERLIKRSNEETEEIYSAEMKVVDSRTIQLV